VITLTAARGLSTITGTHSVINFKNIKKDELGPMLTFLTPKKLLISNLEIVEEFWQSLQSSRGRRRRYVRGSMAGLDDVEDNGQQDDESPDEDYDQGTDMNMLEEDEHDDEEYYSDKEIASDKK